jgi:hypothetical protein
VTMATWVIAVASLINSLANSGLIRSHSRRDADRFTDHATRIRQLENGGR